MKNDGRVDVTIRVRGPKNGDPRSYDWRNVDPPVPENDGILRTTLMVRESGEEPTFPITFPWYLLGIASGLPWEHDQFGPPLVAPRNGLSVPTSIFDGQYGPNTNRAPIQVDWERGKIASIAELVTARFDESVWFTYSINRVMPNEVTNPNFESPFAFYDLARDLDGLPELMVRTSRINAGDDTIFAPTWEGRTVQVIRYCWDQSNTQTWSYKLALMGQHEFNQEVAFPDFTLLTKPYNEFPGWVMANQWDVAAFVASETKFWTSEGIYDWDPSSAMRDGYYAGVSNRPDNYESLSVGLRGDVNVHLSDQPWLTLNPIDRELHLYRAERGVWNIDETREMRFLASTTTYIDGWQLWAKATASAPRTLVAQLYRVPGGLIYSDQWETLYRETTIPDELFRILPPTNNTEWLALGDRLEEVAVEFPAGDLRAMFDQFDGDLVRVAAGPMTGFTRVPGGVRFAVDGAPPATRYALASLTGQSVHPGLLDVRAIGGQWAVTTGTPARAVVTIAAPTATNLQNAPARITVTNDGSQDLVPVTVQVNAIAPGGGREFALAQEFLTLPSGAVDASDLAWFPDQPGQWTIRATVTERRRSVEHVPKVLAVVDQGVTVLPNAVIRPTEAAKLGWPAAVIVQVMVVAGLFLGAGTIATLALRAGRPTP